MKNNACSLWQIYSFSHLLNVIHDSFMSPLHWGLPGEHHIALRCLGNHNITWFSRDNAHCGEKNMIIILSVQYMLVAYIVFKVNAIKIPVGSSSVNLIIPVQGAEGPAVEEKTQNAK